MVTLICHWFYFTCAAELCNNLMYTTSEPCISTASPFSLSNVLSKSSTWFGCSKSSCVLPDKLRNAPLSMSETWKVYILFMQTGLNVPTTIQKHEQNYTNITRQQLGKYPQESGNRSFVPGSLSCRVCYLALPLPFSWALSLTYVHALQVCKYFLHI